MRTLVLPLALAAAAGCAPDVSQAVDAAPRPDAEPRIPMGSHHDFVLDSISLPTDNGEAEDLGLDIDGDGEVDNQLGTIIALLATNGNDTNANLTQMIDRGEIIHLADVQADALDDASNVGMFVWKGGSPAPLPCVDTFDTVCRQHLGGTGSFDVTAEDPEDAMIFGSITGGHFSGGSGGIVLEVPLLLSATPLVLQLIGAHAEVDVSDTALTSGRLAGAVTDAYIQSDVLPQLHNVLGVVVADDCFGTAPSCCDADSDGETVVNLFDSDGDCEVSLQELQNSGLLDSVLAPDVDLLDEEGLDGSDGVDESVSLGIGFTAVGAVYDTPNGL